MIPASAARCRRAKASTGVGHGRAQVDGDSRPGEHPRPRRRTADRCRASQPMTTVIRARRALPGGAVLAQPAGQRGRGRPDHARFIRLGPAPTAPRSPAVPNSSRPRNLSASSAAAPPPSSSSAAQFGPVPLVRVLADPALGLGTQVAADHGVCPRPGGLGALARRVAQPAVRPGGHDAGQEPASSAPIRPAAASRPRPPRRGPAVRRQPGRQVAHQRDGQHLGAEMAGGDGFEGRGHPTRSAPACGASDLGRRLVVGAGQRGIDALGQAGVARAGQRAQPGRVQLGQVGEPRRVPGGGRAGQRGPAGQVQVVADQHRLADPVTRIDPARRVGEHDHLAPAATAVRTPCTTVAGG